MPAFFLMIRPPPRSPLFPYTTLSRSVSHKPDSVVDDRRFPRREIRLRPTASKSDTREADDVGFLRGEGEELRTVAANENWRVRLLHGQRIDGVVGHSIVSPRERDTLAREPTPYDDDRLCQAPHPRAP